MAACSALACWPAVCAEHRRRLEVRGRPEALRGLIAAGALSLCLVCASAVAFAQAPAAAPNVVASGAALSPTVVGREFLEQPAPERGKADVSLPPQTGVKVPPELAGREVEFKKLVVEGSTVFGPADFAPIFAPVLHRRVTVAEVAAAADKVNALYQEAGYVFYAVTVPQQDLGGDTLHVVVMEGAVSAVEIDPAITSPAVRLRLMAVLDRLRGKHPLKRSELERRLLLAADTPGVTVSASAKPDPSGDPSRVVLTINGKFERYTPIGQIDSFQTTPDTQVNLRAGLIGRSMFLGGDQLEGRYLFALPWNRLQMFDVRYGLPVGDDGGRLSFLGQAVWQRPLFTVNGQPVDFLGRSFLGRIQYAYPIVRRQKWTVTALGMVDGIATDYSLAGVYLPGDSLRVPRIGLSTTFADDWAGVWQASALVSTGLDVANAFANNRFSASPSFTKVNLSLERDQAIGKHFALIAKGVAQGTSGTVPSAEVFAFGGRDFGRAFNVAESVSDRGIALSAELRYALDWLPIPKDKVQPHAYVFADKGWLSSDDPRNAPYFYEASSAGGGIRAKVLEKFTGEVEFATALSESPVGVGSPPWRVSFRIGTFF